MELMALVLSMMLYPFILDVIYDYLRYYEVWFKWFFQLICLCLVLSLTIG